MNTIFKQSVEKVFKQSFETVKSFYKYSKFVLPITLLAVLTFIVLYIYCYRYNMVVSLDSSVAFQRITLEQFIHIASFVFIVWAFASFIPATFYLFIGKKQKKLKASIHKNLKRIDPDYNKDVVEEKFNHVFKVDNYTFPLQTASLICFFGWLFVLFPYGPLLGNPEHFKDFILVDFKGIITNIGNNAPLVTYGFLGAYFYSIQFLFRRSLQADLKPTTYMFVNMRFFISFIIVFVASLLFSGEIGVFCAFAFFVGIFPTSGINWIQRSLIRYGFPTRKTMEDGQSLYLIEGLTIWDETRLMEEGIENVQNLATTNVQELIINTNFNTNRLIDWIDQAYLIMHVSTRISNWRYYGIRSASDFLNAYGNGVNDSLVESNLVSEHEVELYHSSMNTGPNKQLITSWWQRNDLDN